MLSESKSPSCRLNPSFIENLRSQILNLSSILFGFCITSGFFLLFTFLYIVIFLLAPPGTENLDHILLYIQGFFLWMTLVVVFYTVRIFYKAYRHIRNELNPESDIKADGRLTIRGGQKSERSSVEQGNAIAMSISIASIGFLIIWNKIIDILIGVRGEGLLPGRSNWITEAEGMEPALFTIIQTFTGFPIESFENYFTETTWIALFQFGPSLIVLFIGFRYGTFLIEKATLRYLSGEKVVKPFVNEINGFSLLIFQIGKSVTVGHLRDASLQFIGLLALSAMILFTYFRLLSILLI